MAGITVGRYTFGDNGYVFERQECGGVLYHYSWTVERIPCSHDDVARVEAWLRGESGSGPSDATRAYTLGSDLTRERALHSETQRKLDWEIAARKRALDDNERLKSALDDMTRERDEEHAARAKLAGAACETLSRASANSAPKESPRGKPVKVLLCQDPHGGWTVAYFREGQSPVIVPNASTWSMKFIQSRLPDYREDAVAVMDAELDDKEGRQ
jgi:hypothetical protein